VSKEQVLNSLDAHTEALFPYLPYLLQDLFALGSFPEKIIELLKRNHFHYKNALELGCGKGAVSIALAKHLDIQVTGIDAIPEFIREAKIQAARRQVESLCKFHTEDISNAVNKLSGYDLVVLASVGSLWNSLQETLNNLSKCLITPGLILFDDGYLTTPDIHHAGVFSKKETYEQFHAAGLEIIDEMLIDSEQIQRMNTLNLSFITTRANELAAKHPDKKEMFLEFVKIQAKENNFYDQFFQGVIWLLMKK